MGGHGEIAIVGLGSVGRRHLANLRTLGWERLLLVRTGHATLAEAELRDLPTVWSLDEALARRPLALIVANPTSLHVPVATAAARSGTHFLIEKPISDDEPGLDCLERLVADRQLTALVGYQFRFHPGLRQIKAWLDEGAIGEILNVQATWGEFLPDMHPWEDHRRGYAGRRELGGGVLLTLCHPFDYLRWMLGDLDVVAAIESAVPALGISVEACADVFLRPRGGGSVHVHLDFVRRPTEHRLAIVGTEGTLTWTQEDGTARWFVPSLRTWVSMPPPAGFNRNTMFLDELRHFLACLRGDAHPCCTLADGRATVVLVREARRAMSVGSTASLP